MLGRFLSRTLLATLLGVAGGAVVTSGPAAAAACVKGTGVTAVVDFHELGGGTRTVCVPSGGGKYADTIFGQAGIGMTYATQEAGFVCRVEDVPASAPCQRASSATAYWSLWWSDGSGSWSYASSGVGGLKIKTGGFVAWSWQAGSARSAPGVSPVGSAPAPKPTTKPKPATKPSASASAKPSASASASAKAAEKKAKAKAEASASASASPSASGESTPGSDDLVNAANETDGSSGMVWVGAALAALLIIGMGAALWRKRLAGRQP